MALQAQIQPRNENSSWPDTDPENVLFQMDGNPMPPLIAAGYIKVEDEQRIRYARFAARRGPKRGTIVLLSGRNETIEKLFETIGDLCGLGFDVVTFDWRGQGGSSRLLRNRNKGYLDSFDTWREDIEAIFRQIVLPDCRGPYYLLAHSSGALAALYAGPNLLTRVSRMVLLSPFVGFGPLPLSPNWVGRLAHWLVALGFGSVTMWGKTKPNIAKPFVTNRLTSDASRYARNRKLAELRPDLSLGGPTVAWVDAAARAIAKVNAPSHYSNIKTPALFVIAGSDRVVSAPAGARLAAAMRSASSVTVDGARHELLQEADLFREQALAAVDAFFRED
ncbi:alpha/beta fold hydrolase [Notoacmeibacter sp. MSK16QG-6]|uniref:alpha/beta fold hydrolase n=1 Tax=Notoacmeibacter sp. MSK16QG-6 TaxID=2957982 RepID=UPI00209D6C85|nr:alpha/beta hydrolase [Notoacmeibacter sp. MSK16QG-6]MCP1200358.1 alpha/beta hydrolase [Notoacmeibacter sp. MSK16QG-6]